MATKTRLNEWRRDILRSLATTLVTADPELLGERECVAKNLSEAVRGLVVARYPQDDMKVLLKYDMATRDKCIRLRFDNGREEQTNLLEEPFPLRPGGPCHRYVYLAPDSVKDLFETVERLDRVISASVVERLKPYLKLVSSSQTYEDVLAVWPEAEKARESIGATLNGIVTSVTAEEIEAIQADMARRNTGE